MPAMRKPTNMWTGKEQAVQSPLDMVGPMAMMGGIPEGLNPTVIQMLMKQLGIAGEEAPAIAGAVKKAAPAVNNGPNTGMFHDLWESLSNGASDMMTKRRYIPLVKE